MDALAGVPAAASATLLRRRVEEWRRGVGGGGRAPPPARFLLHIFRREDLMQVVASKVFGAGLSTQALKACNTLAAPLWCIDPRGRFRVAIVRFVYHPYFERVILAIIVLNSVIECIDVAASASGWAADLRRYSDVGFVCIFAVEAALKIVAHGFVLHRKAYLRSAWNVLDFVVLLASVTVVSISEINVLGRDSPITQVRFVRIIRPLRTFRRVKGLAVLVNAIIAALPTLVDVCLMIGLIVCIFAVLGLQLWKGDLDYRCFAYPPGQGAGGTVANATAAAANSSWAPFFEPNGYFLYEATRDRPCGWRRCPVDPNFDVRCEKHLDVYTASISYDHIGHALIEAIRVVALDDWHDEMFYTQDAYTGEVSWLYFMLLTLIGGYLLLCLVVSVLSVSFSESSKYMNVLGSRVVPPDVIGTAPMTPTLYAFNRPKNSAPCQCDAHYVRRDSSVLAVGGELGGNRYRGRQMERTMMQYFGQHRYLAEYRNDYAAQVQKQRAREEYEQKVAELREVVEDSEQLAATLRKEVRPIPSTLRADNLLGLDIFQVLAAVACPRVGMPLYDSPNLEASTTASRPPSDVSSQHRLRRRAQNIVTSRPFQYFMLGITMASVIALATDHHGISPTHEDAIRVIAVVCGGFFIAEALLKIVVMGVRRYFADPWNCLDFVIAVIAVPDYIWDTPVGVSSVVRALRVFRLIGLMSHSQREMVDALGHAAPDLGSIVILLGVVVFMFGLLGVDLFGSAFPDSFRENYNSLWHAFVTAFILVIGDGWNAVSRRAIDATSDYALIYFLAIFFFGKVIVTSLFPAVLIDRLRDQLRKRKHAAQKRALRQLKDLGMSASANPVWLTRTLMQRQERYTAAVAYLKDEHARASTRGIDANTSDTRSPRRNTSPARASPERHETNEGSDHFSLYSGASGIAASSDDAPAARSADAHPLAVHHNYRTRRAVARGAPPSTAPHVDVRVPIEAEEDRPPVNVTSALGFWRAEVAVGKGRVFWANSLTGQKTWENPLAAQPVGRDRDAVLDIIDEGDTVEAWVGGAWMPATILGRRADGRYTVFFPTEQAVQVGVNRWLLRRVDAALPLLEHLPRSLRRTAERLLIVPRIQAMQGCRASGGGSRRASTTPRGAPTAPDTAEAALGTSATVACARESAATTDAFYITDDEGVLDAAYFKRGGQRAAGNDVGVGAGAMANPLVEIFPVAGTRVPSRAAWGGGGDRAAGVASGAPIEVREAGQALLAYVMNRPLIECYNHPDLGGLMLLWCALSAKGKHRLEVLWNAPESRAKLVRWLYEDGTLHKTPQPLHDEEENPDDVYLRARATDKPTPRGGGPGVSFCGIYRFGDDSGIGGFAEHVAEAALWRNRLATGRALLMRRRARQRAGGGGQDAALCVSPGRYVFQGSDAASVSRHHRARNNRLGAPSMYAPSQAPPPGSPAGSEGSKRAPPESRRFLAGDGHPSTRDPAGGGADGNARAHRRTRLNPDSENYTSSTASATHRLLQALDEDERIAENALGLFEKDSPVRRRVYVLIHHRLTQYFLLAATLGNAVVFALDDAYAEERAGGRDALRYATVGFICIFVAELAMKAVALGLYKAPGACMRDPWNVADAVVVVSQVLWVCGVPAGGLLRGVRAVRLIVYYPPIKAFCEVLLSVLPDILKLVLVYILVWILFGVTGVSLFKGHLFGCSDPDALIAEDCVGVYDRVVGNATSADALSAAPRVWQREARNFDHLGHAFVTLLYLHAQEGWRGVMWRVVDATGVEAGPVRDAHPWRVVYFVLFMLVGYCVLQGLLVAVLVNGFLSAKHIHGQRLTSRQRKWMRMQQIVTRHRLHWRPRVPQSHEWGGLRLLCYRLWDDWRFDAVMYTLIVLNYILIATDHEGVDATHADVIRIGNTVFVVLFALEALVKIMALGVSGYLAENWNRFDLFCVVLSIAGIFLNLNTTVVRVARVVRGVRVFKKAERLRQLERAIQRSLPSLFNAAMLMIFVFYNYALVGMDMFKYRTRRTHVRFDTLPHAAVVLYQLAALEGWTYAMEEMHLEPPECAPQGGECGETFEIFLYFASATTIGAFLLMNLSLYVVLESYVDVRREFNGMRTEEFAETFKLFRDQWTEADHTRRQKIGVDEFLAIVELMPPPFWSRRDGRTQWITLLNNVKTLPVPITADREVGFENCMMALALKAVGIRKHDAVGAINTSVRRKVRKFLDPSLFTIEHAIGARRIEHFFKRWQARRVEQQEIVARKAQLAELLRLHAKAEEAHTQRAESGTLSPPHSPLRVSPPLNR